METSDSFLLTDLYQLAMIEAYAAQGMDETAVFELFVRRLPASRNFLVAAGLEQALDYLEALRAGPEALAWLRESGLFGEAFLRELESFRFTGDVHAMPEGTVFHADEPILRVTAPLPQAQYVETRLMNILHYQTLIASKAARMVLAARGRAVVDFGLRRAHGAEAGLFAARAGHLGGLSGTATVLAGKRFGVPVFGTMAHSFVQAFDTEAAAFESFARTRPDNLVLLLDTYDTVAAARKVCALAPTLERMGVRVRGVRLDSGDLAYLARTVRAVLDEGGLGHVTIFASGGLDEAGIDRLVRSGAPVDGFGVGTSLTTSSDVPALDCAYKLQEYAGRARRKRSAGKATWPGRKQVWRHLDAAGRMTGDVVSVETDAQPGVPLLRPVMRGGRRLEPSPSLAAVREHARSELDRLPDAFRSVHPAQPYPVTIAPALQRLAEEVDRRAV